MIPDNVRLYDWISSQVQAEGDWFHRMELPGGIVTPGWSDPRVDKLPHFGLPQDMSGMRVLDIGAAEGFFAFEAERRGAAEVIALEVFPPMVRKFNLCRYALGSGAQAYLGSVYDLNPRQFGTFDAVFFFGVLYHLRHPILALEKIASICTGTLHMQTATCDNTSVIPMAEFHPFGVASGPADQAIHDPSCFWFPNRACCRAMLEHVGFGNVEDILTGTDVGAVLRARAPVQSKGTKPNEATAPWS